MNKRLKQLKESLDQLKSEALKITQKYKAEAGISIKNKGYTTDKMLSIYEKTYKLEKVYKEYIEIVRVCRTELLFYLKIIKSNVVRLLFYYKYGYGMKNKQAVKQVRKIFNSAELI